MRAEQLFETAVVHYHRADRIGARTGLRVSRSTVAVAALVIATVVAAPAEASSFWYFSDDPVYAPDRAYPVAPKRQHHRKRSHPEAKLEKQLEKQATKPQGPLLIAVSIEQQKVRIYDDNGLFAEAPVSTGMRGHATPMGVFSVIQKHKWHRSNIYSGAPMPYMQRITWSGVALHAGVLPGYPASHGCIRMPTAFAIKMWGWTRMGARVIVSPGEIAPASFTHPLLVAKKIALDPEPIASDLPKPVTSTKADKQAAVDQPGQADLRPGVEIGDAAAGAPQPTSDQVRTADASGGTVTMTDASAKPAPSDATATPLAADANARAEMSSKASPADAGQDQPNAPAAQSADAAKMPGTQAATDQPSATGSVDGDKADKPDAAAAAKDQSRASGADQPAPALVLPTPKPKGQLAAFVSGKDGKLYVRQDQTPLFSIPIKIAPGDRPLGTHVFTAEVDKDNNVHWTVASLPASRVHESNSEHHKSRRHKNALAEAPKPAPQADNPSEALDRLEIPPEAIKRIAEGISSGGSLIVSDQAIAAGETGEGTDFIIRLR